MFSRCFAGIFLRCLDFFLVFCRFLLGFCWCFLGVSGFRGKAKKSDRAISKQRSTAKSPA